MKQTITDNMTNTCFFCSKPISEKKTLEHIIPDSLLGKLGIKEQEITGTSKTQYSRLKVPAHKTCNSEFGSRYESKIISLFENPDELYKTLKSEDFGILTQYSPSNSSTMLISTWLSKIYYGLFYNDFIKTKNKEWKNISKNIIDCDNFRMVQKSYQENNGFCLPSSLFVFKSTNTDFDLKTIIQPQVILLKINTIILILSIGDGFLCKNYLNGIVLNEFSCYLSNEEFLNSKFPVHLFALAEIISLRHCIPKTPRFIYSDNEIHNMSLSTCISNPNEYYKIDEENLELRRKEVLATLGIELVLKP